MWMTSLRVVQYNTLHPILYSVTSKWKDWVDSDVINWDKKPRKLPWNDMYLLEWDRSVKAIFLKWTYRCLLKKGAINFLSLSMQALSGSHRGKALTHKKAAFSLSLLASHSALQFTEHVHLVYLICSLPSPSEVCRAGLSIFILQMSKLKLREVIISEWNSVFWLLIQLFPLSRLITLRIKSLLFIQPPRCLGYQNW